MPSASRATHPRPTRAQWAALTLAALGLGACARYAAAPAAPAAPQQSQEAAQEARYVYTCPDGYRFSASFRADSAALSLADRQATLPQVVAASGVRYQAGELLLWTKGEQARLEVGGTVREGCAGAPAPTSWEEARLLGATFRAVGQEPGWVVELGPERGLRFEGEYGRQVLTAPLPQRTRDGSGATNYHVRTAAHELTLTLREAPCRDAMSGEAFPHTVSVRLDGRELRGCGRPLDATPLLGTYWKLVGLGGEPAVQLPGQREAHLRLQAADGGRVAGSTGCNLLHGSFTQQGQQLRFSPLAMTRVACAEAELNRQEQEFVRLLAAVDRFSVTGAELVLYAGERVLARFVAADPQP